MQKYDVDNTISYFNILKFIGAICVGIILHYNDHLLPYLNVENPFKHYFLWYLSHNSFLFVEMFFIISGILFARVYLKKIIGGMNFLEFFKKRVLRVMPLVVITSFVMYVANFILFKYNGTFWSCGTLSIWDLFVDIVCAGKAIFNTANTLNGPIWYINVLLLCYIIAYYVVGLYKKYSNKFIFIIPIILGVMIRYSKVSFLIWNESVARGLIAFFLGIMVNEYLKRMDKMSDIKRRKIKVCLLIYLLMFAFVVYKDRSNIFITDSIFCYDFLFFPELIVLLYDLKRINRICSSKVVAFLGSISFGMYMWNFPILIMFHILYKVNLISFAVTSYTFIMINIIVHLMVGSLSYLLIDVKLGNFLKRKYLVQKVKL